MSSCENIKKTNIDEPTDEEIINLWFNIFESMETNNEELFIDNVIFSPLDDGRTEQEVIDIWIKEDYIGDFSTGVYKLEKVETEEGYHTSITLKPDETGSAVNMNGDVRWIDGSWKLVADTIGFWYMPPEFID